MSTCIRPALATAVLTAALLASGCGSSSSSDTTTPAGTTASGSTTTASSAATNTPAPSAAAAADIYQVPGTSIKLPKTVDGYILDEPCDRHTGPGSNPQASKILLAYYHEQGAPAGPATTGSCAPQGTQAVGMMAMVEIEGTPAEAEAEATKMLTSSAQGFGGSTIQQVGKSRCTSAAPIGGRVAANACAASQGTTMAHVQGMSAVEPTLGVHDIPAEDTAKVAEAIVAANN